jgi:hypothetical protein
MTGITPNLIAIPPYCTRARGLNPFFCWRCTPKAGRIHTKAKAPVLENTFRPRGSSPHRKRDFVVSRISSCGLAHTNGFGQMGLSVRLTAQRGLCFQHLPPHTMRLKTHGWFEPHHGVPTMQTKPTGHTVPTPTTRPTPTEAITASILATWYIRNGKKIQAQRKLRQALQALGQ